MIENRCQHPLLVEEIEKQIVLRQNLDLLSDVCKIVELGQLGGIFSERFYDNMF